MRPKQTEVQSLEMWEKISRSNSEGRVLKEAGVWGGERSMFAV